MIGLIAGTQAAGANSQTGQTTTGGEDTCYLWNNKKWKGVAPTNPVATECGGTVCTLCPDQPYVYKKPIPTWKKTGNLYPTNPAWINNPASGTGYLTYAFKQDDYSESSQYAGSLNYLTWCQNQLYGVKLTYGLRDFCNGKITEPYVTVGNYNGVFTTLDCQTLNLVN